MFLSVSEAAKVWGVSASTMRRWDNEGVIKADFRTKGDHRRYDFARMIAERDESTKKKVERTQFEQSERPVVVGYARVSAHKQKNDLQTQIETLGQYADDHDWALQKVFYDIASGMNEQRKGLLSLLRLVAIERPFAVICTFEDRIARFGRGLIEFMCDLSGTKVIPIKQTANVGEEEQLVNDVLALMTSFTGKLHRRRRRDNNAPHKSIT